MSQQHRDGADVDRAPVNPRAGRRRAASRRVGPRRGERARRVAFATAGVVARLLRGSALSIARAWSAARLEGLRAAMQLELLDTRQMLDAVPLNFKPINPLGVQAYEAAARGALASTAQSDVYQVKLNDAGKLSFVASTTDASLRLHVVVTNDSTGATVVAPLDAATGGATLGTQNLALAAGTYDVTVTADATPANGGAYKLAATVNASIQSGTPTNATTGTATGLAGSGKSLAGGGQQYAATGTTGAAADSQYYKIDLTAGQFVSAALSGAVVGTGQYGAATKTDVLGAATVVATGDLDGDGLIDIVAGGTSPFGGDHGLVTILKNNGDGTFTSDDHYVTDYPVTSIAIGDASGDPTRPDILVGEAASDPTQNVGGTVFIKNNGFGNYFYDDQITATQEQARVLSVAIADLDGDGSGDLVSAGYGTNADATTYGYVHVDYTNGGSSIGITGGTAIRSMIVADVNGDGTNDLVTARENDEGIEVDFGTGDANNPFGGGSTNVAYGNTYDALALGDADGNGTPDLVGLKDGSSNGNRVYARAVLLDASGNDQGEYDLDLGSGSINNLGAAIYVGDVNSDGRADIVATAGVDGTIGDADGNGDGYDLVVARNDGFMSFNNRKGYQLTGAAGLAVADVTGDGRADLVTASPNDNATDHPSAVQVLADTASFGGGAGTLRLLDPTGKVIATGLTADDAAGGIQSYVARSTGTYYVQVTGAANVDYALSVTRNAAIGFLPSYFGGRPADLTGAGDLIGYLDSGGGEQGTSFEIFNVGAAAGDTLTIHFNDAPAGPNAGANSLVGYMQLNAPDDPNVEGDGQSVGGDYNTITYTVPAGKGGTYSLYVLGITGSGLFDVTISGSHGVAPAPTVDVGVATGTGPTGPNVNYGFPRPLYLYASQGVDATSIDLSKFTLNGHAATSVNVVDQTRLEVRFDASADTGDGDYAAVVAAGAFRSLAGVANVAKAQTFTVDTGAKVTAADIHEGDTIAPGARTFNFTFSKTLLTGIFFGGGGFGSYYQVLDGTDMQLYNKTTGTSIPVTNFQLGPYNVYGTPQESTTIAISFANLPEGQYELRLRSGTDAFADLHDVPLDGDNAGTLPSGDGYPYGDYVVNFNVDRAAATSLGKPTLLAPNGGQAYAFAPVVGAIDPDTDVDDYTFAAQAGDQFTANVATTAGYPQLRVDLLAPDGSVVATRSGDYGESVSFRNVALATTGTYRIHVASAGQGGAYAIAAYLNADVKRTVVGAAANDAIATAQPLDFGDANNGGIDRAAVVGTGDGVASDYYSVALAAGQRLSASIAISAGTGTAAAVTAAPTAGGKLALVDASGRVVALGVADAGAANYTFNDFAAPAAGTYYVRVMAGPNHTLAVARNATFELEPNDAVAAPQDIGRTKRAAGYLATGGDVDGYTFNANVGDALTILTAIPDDVAAVGYNGLQTVIRLYAPDGTLLLSNQGGAPGDANASRILYAVPAGGAGAYRVVVTAAGTTSGTYALTVAGATGAATLASPSVVSAAPATGAVAAISGRLANAPTTITFTFDAAIDPTSVAAGDLTLGSGSVTSVRLIDGRTVEFTVATPNVDSTLNYALAAGAVSSLVGVPSAAYASSVVIDRHGPRVVSVSPNGSATAPFNKIVFTFDEALAPLPTNYYYQQFFAAFTSPTQNLLTAGYISNVAISGNTFTVTFYDQTAAGDYKITLAPFLTDLVGNKQDQDGDFVNGEATQDQYATTITVGSPDLIVSGVAPAAGAVYGTPTDVTWTVKNNGSSTADGSWVDRVYLSSDGTYDGNDVLLGTFGRPGTLAAGASYTITKPLTFPLTDASAAGTMYVIVLTDPTRTQVESNDDNNTAAQATTVALPPIVDLKVTNVTAPANLVAGQSYVVNWTLSNVGDKDFTGTINENINLSSDATVGNDVNVGGVNFTGTIPAGGSVTRTATVTVPLGTSGAKYFVVEVNPYRNLFEHGSYANNSGIAATASSVALSAQPDFRATNVKGPTSTAFSGANVTFTWTDTNQGNADFNGSFNEDLYLGKSVDGSDAVYFKTVRFSGPIAVGGSVARSATFALPANFPAGNYYPFVNVDTSNEVYENPAGEANNSTVGAQTVTVAVPPLADLTPTNVKGPASALSGQSVPVTWSDKNLGPSALNASWTDNVYLATDAAGTNLQYFTSVTVTANLAAGGSVALSTNLSLPSTFTGTYYVVVLTDAGGNVFEANENNNQVVGATPFTVALAPYPNLIVTAVQSPPTAFSSNTAQVSYFVKNAGTGPTSAPTWYDQVFLSTDQTYDSTDKDLGSFLNPGYLDAGQSYKNTVNVTIPRGLAGTYYFIVRADASGQVNEFGPNGETDNERASGATQVTLTPAPDLRVTTVTAPTRAFSGSPQTVTWTVRNYGPGVTPADESQWNDRVFLSADNVLDAGDVNLGTFGHSGGLNVDQQYTAQGVVSLPTGLSGTFYYIVQSDIYNQVFENGFENNNVGAQTTPTQITLTPPPDLAVTTAAAPATLLSGHVLSVNYAVANQGASGTPNDGWYDSLYLSKTPTLDAGAILVAQRGRSGALASGASYSATIAGQVPYTLASGTYYAIVVTDAGNQVFEQGEANNTLAAAATAFTYAPPDLIVPTFASPATAAAGGGFLVSWTVKNQGAGDTAVDRWRDSVYLSTDSVLGDGDDLLLENFDHVGVLAPGATYAANNKGIVIPTSVASGNYYLLVKTDDGSNVFEGDGAAAPGELNNVGAPQPITITRTAADLQVTGVGTLVNATQGGVATVNFTVRNAGSGATGANYWFDNVYLSPTPSLARDYVFVGQVQHSNALAAGASYDASATFTVPSTLPLGTYYVVVLTDATNRVEEQPGANEQNNVTAGAAFALAAGAEPDLAVTAVNAPATATAGQPLLFTYTTTNVGTAAAVASYGGYSGWYDTVYLSLDQNLDPRTDVALGSGYQPGSLAAGASTPHNVGFTLPNGLAGVYYLFVVSDSSGRVTNDLDPTNNTGQAPTPITIALAPPTDVAIGTVTLPAPPTGGIGLDLGITYTVTNGSDVPAVGSWQDAIYLSKDGTYDANDALLGTLTHTGDVAAGGSYTATLTAPIPGVNPGDYYVIVRTDIRNALSETTKANNVGASLGAITLSVPTLAAGVGSTGSLTTGRSVYYKIDVPYGQTLYVTLNSNNASASNELYLRYGQVPTRGVFDKAYSKPLQSNQSITVPLTKAGTYYLLAYGGSVPGGETYTLTASLPQFGVTDTTYGKGGTAGNLTLQINGSKFDRTTTATLTKNGAPVAGATAYYYTNQGRLYATFDLTKVAPGAYDVTLRNAAGATAVVANGLTVVAGGGGRLQKYINSPGAVRGTYSFQVDWSNDGINDIGAPYLAVKSTGNVGKNPRYITSPGYTFIGTAPDDGPAGILRPSQTGTATFFSVNGPTTVSLGNVDDANATFHYDHYRDELILPGENDVAFDAAWARMQQDIGPTFGEAMRALDRDATLLPSVLGLDDIVASLLQVDLLRAKAEITTSVSGTVGAPDITVDIAGKTVTAHNRSTGQYFATTSYNDGSFVFANLTAGTYDFEFDGAFVNAAANGLAVAPNQHVTNLRLALTAGQSFAGAVRDAATSAGVDGASVVVVLPDGTTRSTTTDDDGTYAFAGLPDGPYTIFAQADGYARAFQSFTPGPGVDANDFSLAKPGGAITGHLALPAGNAGGVVVIAQLDGHPGAEGTFIATIVGDTFAFAGLPAGTYTVDFLQAGSVGREASVDLQSATLDLGTVTLVGAASVGGVVTSVDPSIGVGGLSIELLPVSVDGLVDPRGLSALETNADGTFTLAGLAPGTYTLRITPAAGYVADVPITVTADQRIVGLSIPIRPGDTLRGTVTSATTGNALAGVRVRAIGPDGRSTLASTDAAGRYSFVHLRPGAYTVTVPGATATATLAEADDSTATADLAVGVAGTVTGRVKVGNAGAAGASVNVYSGGQFITSAYANADGAFSIVLATAGTYDLIAVAPGATFVPTSVTVSGGTAATATFTAGNGSIAATVGDAFHFVADDAVFLSYVTANSGAIDVAQLQPDVGGNVTFSGLAAGQYILSLFTVHGRVAVKTVTVAAAGNVTASLVAANGNAIGGTVIDAGGAAVHGAIATVYSVSGGVATPVLRAATGADGTYSFVGLADGTYDVVFYAAGRTSVVRTNVVVGGNSAASVTATMPLATAHLNGRIVDAAGGASPGAAVNVYDAAGHLLGETAAAADGTFAIDGVAGANLTLRFKADGTRVATKAIVNAVAGGTTTLGDCRLGATLAVAGTAPAADGSAQPGTAPSGGGGTAIVAVAGASSASAASSASSVAGAADGAVPVAPSPALDEGAAERLKNIFSGGLQVFNVLINKIGFSYSKDPSHVYADDLLQLDKCGTCIEALKNAGKAINKQTLQFLEAERMHDRLLGFLTQALAGGLYDLIETAGVLAGLVIVLDGILAWAGVQFGASVVTSVGGVTVSAAIGADATAFGYTLSYAVFSVLGQLNNAINSFQGIKDADDAGDAAESAAQAKNIFGAIVSGIGSILMAFTKFPSVANVGNNISNGGGLLQSLVDYQGVVSRLSLDDFIEGMKVLQANVDAFDAADSLYHKLIPYARAAVDNYNECVQHAPDNECDGEVDDRDPLHYIDLFVSLPPSRDPNDISGPAGFGPAGYVNAARPLGYTIEFENADDAEAPAQVVEVTQQLDADLDYRTFRLGTIVLAGHVITPPGDVAFFQTRVDLTADLGVFVDVFAGVDVATGQAYWYFTAIDPATGERPVDPRVGLLPPDVIAGEGQGFVNYTIRPLAAATTGTTIAAAATIVFDENAPIDTPSIGNTLDLAAATSQVAAIPATTATAGGIALSWTGVDDANGSGIKGYTIYVSTDGGDYVAWLTDTTATSGVYNGAAGHSYRFYSVATDNSGNVEAAPATPDAQTSVSGASATLANLTATTTIAYGAPTATFAGDVTGSPVAGETIAVTLNGKTVSATIYAAGHFAATFDVTAINASTTPYAVTYAYAGNDGLGGATGTTTLTVNKAALTVSVANATKTYGTADPTFAVSYNGFVNGQAASNLGGALAVTTTEPATGYANVGTYAISLAGLASDNYAITYVAGTLVVTKAALTIGGETLYTTYGQPVPVPNAIYTGLAAGETAANLATLPSVSTTATSTSAPGTYAVTVGGAASGNYAITYAAGAIVVAQATPTVTLASPPASIVYDGTTSVDAWAVVTVAKPDGTVGGAAMPTGDVILRFYRGTVVTGAPFFDPPVNAGTYTVVAFYAGDANYGATASAPITYTIDKATPTLTLPTPPANLTADGTTSVDAWAVPTLGGPATAPPPTGPVKLTFYAGSTTTGTALASPPIAPGTYTVVASYNGNSNYGAVTSAPRTFTVNAPQTVALSTTLKVNDGSAQRSMVRSLTVTFNAGVTLAANAITLVDSGGNAVAFTLTASVDGTTYVLTFPAGIGASLANGRYTLVVHADKVGGGTLSGDQTYNVFRLFGDSDGNGSVNGVDSLAFKKAYNTAAGSAKYVDYFDYNGDGKIDAADNAAFAADQGVTI